MCVCRPATRSISRRGACKPPTLPGAIAPRPAGVLSPPPTTASASRTQETAPRRWTFAKSAQESGACSVAPCRRRRFHPRSRDSASRFQREEKRCSPTGCGPSGKMNENSVVIAHISDLHFGGYADLAQIEALEEFIPSLGATAVVVSGDLTQRARHGEFQAAHAFLARLRSNLPL